MIRIPENVMAFAQANESIDLFKAFGDYFNHYKHITFKSNVDFDNTKTFDEKTDKLHSSIVAEIGKIAGANTTMFSDSVWRTNPNYRWATYAVIGALIDSILPETIIEDFGAFAEVRTGGYGDSFAFDIKPNDLFIVSKAGNGKRHAFAQRQFNSQATLIPENRMVTVEEDLYRILAGKVNMAEFAMKCALSFETELSTDIFKCIDNTFSTLPANFKEASFTTATLTKLAQRVAASNGGAKSTIFGTKAAISNILPSNEYLKMQLGEVYNRTGYLSTFMGVDIFEIKQKIDWTDGLYGFALDDTRLYVVSTSSQKLVKIAIEGDVTSITDQVHGNANLVQTTSLNKRWAVGLISNARYGIIDIS